jgi:hypothetical protein
MSSKKINKNLLIKGIIMLLVLFDTLVTQEVQNSIAVKKCSDFAVDGQGTNTNWSLTDWVTITQRKIIEGTLNTSLKILYSDSGIYFLFKCQDRRITASMPEDFMDLWKEDVVEVFLWPDEDYPIYFEYEISPLNRELVLLVPNLKGKFLGWRPWHYEGNRKIVHSTSASGGELKSGAQVESWVAEFCIPFELLTPLGKVPPVKGTIWRANFYRGDYDLGEWESWAWQPIEKRFHEYQKFGYLHFE